MMGETVRRVCVLSVAFGIASTLTDNRGAEHIMRILCTCILLICLLEPVKRIDFDSFSLDMARYRAREEEILQNGRDMSTKLNREIIENEYAAYIMEKAEEMGVNVSRVIVKTKWDTEGIWVPNEAYIEYESDARSAAELGRAVKLELGIPEERQTWTGK